MDPAVFHAFLESVGIPPHLRQPALQHPEAQAAFAAHAAASASTAPAAAPAAAVASPTNAQTGQQQSPSAVFPQPRINLAAQEVAAPQGYMARTLVRIRRARPLHAPSYTPDRPMYVVSVLSKLVPQMDDDDDVEPEPSPAPPAPVAASPYRFGASVPAAPPAPVAASNATGPPPPVERERRVTGKRRHADTGGDDESDAEERGDSDDDDEDADMRDAAATLHEDDEKHGGDSASETDGGRDGEKQPQQQQQGSVNARNKILRTFSMSHLVRSGVRSLNIWLGEINYRTQDMLELSSTEFVDLIPAWILGARMPGGVPYVWSTIKGYINSLQRVARMMHPYAEWGHISLKDVPAVREAITELRAREHEDTKARMTAAGIDPDAPPPPPPPSSVSNNVVLEMTTRRQQRIANGEVLPLREPSSQPSSAPNSPRLSARGGGGDDAEFPSTGGGGRGRNSLIPRLTPEQEAYIIAQLDPAHPQGLFRLLFIAFIKHFGITYAEEHRGLTLSNMLRASKEIKVRYAGGLLPPPAREEAAIATKTEPAAAEVAPAAASAASADAMDTTDGAAAPAAPAANAAPAADAAAAPAADGIASAVTAAAPDAVASDVVPATDSAPAAAASDAVYADEMTPFEVVDQQLPLGEDGVVLRRVRFVAFVPSALSKRSMAFMYERPWEGVYCPVRLYETFLSHRPPLMRTPPPGLTQADCDASQALWLKLKKSMPADEPEWFLPSNMGRNMISQLVASLCSALGFTGGFSNASVPFEPKPSIVLTSEEIDAIRAENERCDFGVPTKEQHALAQQQAVMAHHQRQQQAQQELLQAHAQEQSADHSFSLPQSHAPAGTSHKSRRSKQPEHSSAAAAHASAHLSALAQFSPPVAQAAQSSTAAGRHQTSSAAAAAPVGPRDSAFAFGHAARRSFYPSSDDVSPHYLQLNHRALLAIDEANERAQAERQQQQQQAQQDSNPAAPVLLAPTQLRHELPQLSAPPLTLAPASVSSVPSLLRLLNSFDGDLASLSAHAAQCQRSLESLRAMSSQLRSEAHSALQAAQQTAKIAEQHRIIEEQKFLIEQLQAEKRGSAPDTAAAAGEAQQQQQAMGSEEKSQPMQLDEEEDDDLPPLVQPTEAAAYADDSKQATQADASAAAASKQSPPRFHDQQQLVL